MFNVRRKNCKGSITVFAALAIMLVAQFLFTLIEASRRIEFEKVMQMNTESVLESVFADYCSPLWEEYHLLGVTAANEQELLSFNNRCAQMNLLTKTNLGADKTNSVLEGMSLFHADAEDIEATSYALMTDGRGLVFEQAVSAYMKENLAYEMAKAIYNNFEGVKDVQKEYGDGNDKINGALDALESAAKEQEEASSGKKSRMKRVKAKVKEPDSEDNPLTAVVDAQKSGVLQLVLPSNAHLSNAAFASRPRVTQRVLTQGNEPLSQKVDWFDRTLFTQYVCNYMSSYTTDKPNHALRYEVEYLIGGKDTDADNLKAMVNRLLLMREPLNMASLMASPSKQAQAESLALVLVGATVNPLIIEAVKYGILAAWAYVESVLDVRALLDGDKIALVKGDATWTSTIENFPSLLSGWSKAKSCEAGGLNYMQYAEILLLFEAEKQIAMRAMDLQEATVRSIEGYENFYMDHVACVMEIQVTYVYKPFFLTFVSLVKNQESACRIIDKARYSYFEGKEGV